LYSFVLLLNTGECFSPQRIWQNILSCLLNVLFIFLFLYFPSYRNVLSPRVATTRALGFSPHIHPPLAQQTASRPPFPSELREGSQQGASSSKGEMVHLSLTTDVQERLEQSCSLHRGWLRKKGHTSNALAEGEQERSQECVWEGLKALLAFSSGKAFLLRRALEFF